MNYEPRLLLRAMFDAAIAAAQPALCVPAHLPPPPKGRLIVIGAGKASAAMAEAVEHNWAGPLEGPVMATPRHAAGLKSSKPIIRSPMPPVWRPPSVF